MARSARAGRNCRDRWRTKGNGPRWLRGRAAAKCREDRDVTASEWQMRSAGTPARASGELRAAVPDRRLELVHGDRCGRPRTRAKHGAATAGVAIERHAVRADGGSASARCRRRPGRCARSRVHLRTAQPEHTERSEVKSAARSEAKSAARSARAEGRCRDRFRAKGNGPRWLRGRAAAKRRDDRDAMASEWQVRSAGTPARASGELRMTVPDRRLELVHGDRRGRPRTRAKHGAAAAGVVIECCAVGADGESASARRRRRGRPWRYARQRRASEPGDRRSRSRGHQ